MYIQTRGGGRRRDNKRQVDTLIKGHRDTYRRRVRENERQTETQSRA